MPLQMFKEMFNGKYDGVTAPTLLPVGGISDGLNVRKVSAAGGWKPRKGGTTHNTTVIAAAAVLSMHQYTHPRNADYHFLAQCNSTLEDALDANLPPDNDTPTNFGDSISSDVGTTPGFSDVIGDLWVYADGSGGPLLWGGDNPFCSGFAVYDASETSYVDYTRDVTDNRTDTEALVLGAADDIYYVCSPQIAKGIKLVLGDTVNDTARTVTINAWRSADWATVGAVTDGTRDTPGLTKTHAKSGTMTWTAGADTMRVINGIMGYWYQVTFNDTLSNSVDVISCQVQFDVARMTNKWNGVFQTPLAVRFYDNSEGLYVDRSGSVSNESTSQYIQLDAMEEVDFIYVKSAEPLTGIGIGIVDGYENTAAVKVHATEGIEHWDGDSWVFNAVAIGDDQVPWYDETLDEDNDSSFAQTGTVWWNATGDVVKRRTMEFDSLPGFWYRMSFDGIPDNTDDDIRMFYVVTVPYPEPLGTYNGVIEFKGRALLWGDKEFPNRLRYSCKDRPDCFSGSDSGYTDAFGDNTAIVCAIRFYNELLVFKANSIWLLEGYSPQTFGTLRISDQVGCCAAKSPVKFEVGSPQMHCDEDLSIAVWMDTDGVYALDGRKPKKVSLPVDHYFNTEYSTAIPATDLADVQAFPDSLNNEYHLLIPQSGSTGHGTELVLNAITDEWFPPWDRTVGGANDYLISGISLRGTGNRYHTYGGGSAGRVYRLEDDTSDKNAADEDVAIKHSVKTRAISADPKQSPSLRFTFRKAFLEAKAVTSPTVKTITTKFYKDVATSGTTITTPAAINLGNTGYSLVMDGVNTNQSRCFTAQLEFIAAVIDLEMEVSSLLYSLEVQGEGGQ